MIFIKHLKKYPLVRLFSRKPALHCEEVWSTRAQCGPHTALKGKKVRTRTVSAQLNRFTALVPFFPQKIRV